MAPPPIPLHVDVPPDVVLGVYPVTLGVPFAPGVLKAADGFDFAVHAVTNGATSVLPVQARPMAWWSAEPDDGVRWLLVDFQVDAEAHESDTQYTLLHGESPIPDFAVVTQLEGASARLKVLVAPGKGYVLATAGEVGIDQVSSRGPIVSQGDPIRFLLADEDGVEKAATIETFHIEEQGPLRTAVRIEGAYPHDHTLGRLILRLEFFAGSPFVRVLHTFVFVGDEDQDRLRGLSMRIPLYGEHFRARFGADHEQLGLVTSFDVVEGPFSMLQDQQHRLHEHARLISDPEGAPVPLVEVRRNAGWMELGWTRGSAMVALRDAWQSYPNEFEIEGNTLRLDFWPRHGRVMDLSKKAILEQYSSSAWPDGWKKHEQAILSGSGNARGVARTHEAWLRFEGGRVAKEVLLSAAAHARHPVFAVAKGEWNCASGALGPMHPEDPERYPEVEAALEAMFDRYLTWNESLRDWGFWDWFDVHESVALRRATPLAEGLSMMEPYRFWSSTHHGFPNAPWVLFYRSGKREYLEVAEANSRHCMDVDRIHAGPNRGAGHYVDRSLVHWGDMPRGADYTQLDFLAYSWYLRGYRRGLEVFEDWGKGILAAVGDPPDKAKGTGIFHPHAQLGAEPTFDDLRHALPPMGNLTELHRLLIAPVDPPANVTSLPAPASALKAAWCREAAELWYEEVTDALDAVRYAGEGSDLPFEEQRRIAHQCFGNKLRWAADPMLNWLRLNPDDETVRERALELAEIVATDDTGLSFSLAAAVTFWPPAAAQAADALVHAELEKLLRVVGAINTRGRLESGESLGWPSCEVELDPALTPASWISQRGSSGSSSAIRFPYNLRSIPVALAAWHHLAPASPAAPASGVCQVTISPAWTGDVRFQLAGPRHPEIRFYVEGEDSRIILRLGRLGVLRLDKGLTPVRTYYREHFECTGIGELDGRQIDSENWSVKLLDETLAGGGYHCSWSRGSVDVATSQRTDGLVDLVGLPAGLYRMRFDPTPMRQRDWSAQDEADFPDASENYYQGAYIERGNVEILHAEAIRLTIDSLRDHPDGDPNGKHCLFGPRFWFHVPEKATSLKVALRLPETWALYDWTPVVELVRHGEPDGANAQVVRRFRGHEAELGSHESRTLDEPTFQTTLTKQLGGWWSIGPFPRVEAPRPNSHQIGPPIRDPEHAFPSWFHLEVQTASGGLQYPRVTPSPEMWLDEG